eukprot:NODE_799_length_3827_cov_1.114002.p2 type:complete len:270 gc:universal NODE_799_length_3827_cov_1.114002:1408-599(-)
MLFLIISMFSKKTDWARNAAIESSDLSTIDALPQKGESTGSSSDLNPYDIDKIEHLKNQIKLENPQIDEIDATQLNECIQSGRMETCKLPNLSVSEELKAQLFEFWADLLDSISSDEEVMQEAEAILTKWVNVHQNPYVELKKRMIRKKAEENPPIQKVESKVVSLAEFRGIVYAFGFAAISLYTYKLINNIGPEVVRFASAINWSRVVKSDAIKNLAMVVVSIVITVSVSGEKSLLGTIGKVFQSLKVGGTFLKEKLREMAGGTKTRK